MGRQSSRAAETAMLEVCLDAVRTSLVSEFQPKGTVDICWARPLSAPSNRGH